MWRVSGLGGRGEAIGRHGAAMTLGGAFGSVLGGSMIEMGGARAGFGIAVAPGRPG